MVNISFQRLNANRLVLHCVIVTVNICAQDVKVIPKVFVKKITNGTEKLLLFYAGRNISVKKARLCGLSLLRNDHSGIRGHFFYNNNQFCRAMMPVSVMSAPQ